MRNRTFSSWTLALVATGAILVFLGAPSSAAALDGKAIFIATKCNLCHTVSSAAIAKTSEKIFCQKLFRMSSRAGIDD